MGLFKSQDRKSFFVSCSSRKVTRESLISKEMLADVEEATEERTHSVADLLPDSKEIHSHANRLSERAEEHRRRVHDRADDDNAPADDEA